MKVLKIILKIIGGLLVFLIVGVAGVLIAARFAELSGYEPDIVVSRLHDRAVNVQAADCAL